MKFLPQNERCVSWNKEYKKNLHGKVIYIQFGNEHSLPLCIYNASHYYARFVVVINFRFCEPIPLQSGRILFNFFLCVLNCQKSNMRIGYNFSHTVKHLYIYEKNMLLNVRGTRYNIIFSLLQTNK